MRPKQRARYAERIERVVARLEQLGDEEAVPGVKDLAVVAALSTFHFHRVFRLMTGETVGQVVRRIRLARGLPALMAANRSVADAAAHSAYATSQSYARAVRASAKLSPSEAKRSPAATAALHAAVSRGRSFADASRPPLSIEVVSVEPFQLVAIRNVGDYSELNHAYERLFAAVFSQTGTERLRGIYGVPLDDPGTVPADQCHFDCALLLDGEFAGTGDVWTIELGGGLHARLRHVGSYDRIHTTIDELYGVVIDSENIQLADAPPHVHYLDDPEHVPEKELKSDIYLPIENADR